MEKAIKASAIISDKDAALKSYLTAADGKSNAQAREISKEILGVDIYWNWDCSLSASIFIDQSFNAPPFSASYS